MQVLKFRLRTFIWDQFVKLFYGPFNIHIIQMENMCCTFKNVLRTQWNIRLWLLFLVDIAITTSDASSLGLSVRHSNSFKSRFHCERCVSLMFDNTMPGFLCCWMYGDHIGQSFPYLLDEKSAKLLQSLVRTERRMGYYFQRKWKE